MLVGHERATQNIIGVLQETEQVADSTAQELANQREQMNEITEQAIEIESMLTRADRLVKVFSKRMMTDKVRFSQYLCSISADMSLRVFTAEKYGQSTLRSAGIVLPTRSA